MNKQESHIKYDSYTQEQKDKLRAWAVTQLPGVLKQSEGAILSVIYRLIRSKSK